MDKDNIKCVKIEVVESNCNPNGWTEYWSPCFTHPYNNEAKRCEFVTACNGHEEMAFANPSLVEFGHWLNDDLGFIADRMTCNFTDGGQEWDRCRAELADLVEECTEEKEVTMRGSKERYAKFRLTPMDKIPTPIIKAYNREMKWNETTKSYDDGEYIDFTDEAFALIVAAVDEANR